MKNICLENKEKLYIANSKDIIKCILDLSLSKFYPHLNLEKMENRSMSDLHEQLDIE